ncbi:hypothetical protein AAFF_G00134100 [Aldrovandia affinis]|uniref:Uncharacterized protein n=1 Tax=Aldrovandia affinis TaxID=143900 RepID=A0AAD7RQC3_9TELE|nr:hypothetical protein AAFF_G00134100 [Aldrovandia affinis]
MPHEVPANVPRRASDPVRRLAPDLPSLPRVQRFSSMSSVNPAQPGPPPGLGPFERRALAPQGYTRSDGSLHRHPYAPRPPSISENVAMETMAGDTEGPGGEEDFVLPDDVVQYIRAQNGGPVQDPGMSGYQSQSFQAAQQPTFYGQRRMAMVDANIAPLPACQVSPAARQHFPGSPGLSRSSMPVQWNEVSSGSVEAAQTQAKQPFARGNLAVVQQKQNFGPFQGVGSNQQVAQMSQNLAHAAHAANYMQRSSGLVPQRMSCAQQQRQQSGNPCQNPGDPMGLQQQQGYNQNSANLRPSCASMAQGSPGALAPNSRGTIQAPEIQNYRSRTQAQAGGDQSHLSFGANHESYSQMNPNQQGQAMPSQRSVQNGYQGLIQPRPPAEPKVLIRQHSAPMHPAGYPQSSFSPGYSTSEASPKRPSGSGRLRADASGEDDTMFYTGQIHTLEPNGTFEPLAPHSAGTAHASAQQCPAEGALSWAAAAVAMASPGVEQVSSTVDSSSQGLEHAQIDFDAMLDDGDHSSLMSGTLSPSVLQSLSQNSSRLTTPRNSVTLLPPVPAGVGNMAIGDMSSMLTALAEESRFLNMMS